MQASSFEKTSYGVFHSAEKKIPLFEVTQSSSLQKKI